MADRALLVGYPRCYWHVQLSTKRPWWVWVAISHQYIADAIAQHNEAQNMYGRTVAADYLWYCNSVCNIMYLTDGIFMCICINEKFLIWVQISLKFVGDKPLSESTLNWRIYATLGGWDQLANCIMHNRNLNQHDTYESKLRLWSISIPYYWYNKAQFER